MLARFPQLDPKALEALSALAPGLALKALRDLEAKGSSIRNVSAWICRTATNMRDREKAKCTPPPPPQPEAQRPAAELLDLVDHYAALEVDAGSDEATIKRAYRRLVLRWHPDKHPEDRGKAEEMIRAINSAYETLSNPTKRSTYDAQRKAIEQWKQGLGPDRTLTTAARQRIPKEFMLQPLGYPDKFVRYSAERARAQCFVHSRADARLEGLRGLEHFVPFFKACKLSLWWLPEVNNMCRIRAMESSKNVETTGGGRSGGLTLGFRTDLEEGRGSGVELVDAPSGGGEKCKNVSFVVEPSPLYDGAFRFQAAYSPGCFLAFRPPTLLRVMPHSSGDAPSFNTVFDFTLVDFQAMFKFIDIEEVLRPVLEALSGWVPIHQLKSDPNVITYFASILQIPMWEDDDFATYFDGHFETWEYRASPGGNAVRLRGVEERLAPALQKAKDADAASELIIEAGDDLRKLPWRNVFAAFAGVAGGGSEDVSKVLRRIEAQRRLLGALAYVLLAASEEASLSELASTAEALDALGGEGAAPDVAAKSAEASKLCAKVALARVSAAERGDHGLAPAGVAVKLEDLGPILALPGLAAKSATLLRHTCPPIADAPLPLLLATVATAQAKEAGPIAAAAAEAALSRVQEAAPAEVAGALRAIVTAGVMLERSAAALERHAAKLGTGELATIIALLGNKGVDSRDLGKAAGELARRDVELARLPAAGLLALAVAATKSAALSACLGEVASAAVSSLGSWPAADVIKLLLAITKAKGSLTPQVHAVVMREAAAVVSPHLKEIQAAELVRLTLAAASSKCGEARELLEAVARETGNRLSDLLPAHLLLLSQGLATLGGKHKVIRKICGFWGRLLTDAGAGREALSAEQLAKLAGIVAPLAETLDGESCEDMLEALCVRLTVGGADLSNASRVSLLEQLGRYDSCARLRRILLRHHENMKLSGGAVRS